MIRAERAFTTMFALVAGCGAATVQLPSTAIASAPRTDATSARAGVEVGLHPQFGPDVAIVAIRVRVDDGAPQQLSREQPSASFLVPSGRHRLVAEGAFLRCTPAQCNGESAVYRTLETNFVARPGCDERLTLDVFDAPEAPWPSGEMASPLEPSYGMYAANDALHPQLEAPAMALVQQHTSGASCASH